MWGAFSSKIEKFGKKWLKIGLRAKKFIVDSEIVQAMVQNDSHHRNTYFGARVAEIPEYADISSFSWSLEPIKMPI